MSVWTVAAVCSALFGLGTASDRCFALYIPARPVSVGEGWKPKGLIKALVVQ